MSEDTVCILIIIYASLPPSLASFPLAFTVYIMAIISFSMSIHLFVWCPPTWKAPSALIGELSQARAGTAHDVFAATALQAPSIYLASRSVLSIRKENEIPLPTIRDL